MTLFLAYFGFEHLKKVRERDLLVADVIDNIEVDIYSIEYAVGTWLVDNVQVSCEVPVYDMDETISASTIQNQFTYNPTGEYVASNICVNFLTYPLTDYDIGSITATIDGSSRTVWRRDNYVYIDTSGLDVSPHTVIIQATRSVEGNPPVADFTISEEFYGSCIIIAWCKVSMK